jgi:glycosyltransferase involved in cell wall biosynthesis
MTLPKFALVSTVFNEIKRLDKSITDIEKQSCRPDQIIIVDAGSKDGTYERLLRWKETSNIPISILQELGCTVAEGRNRAIRLATNDVIASTDFGCRFHADWLCSLISPFSEDPTVEVVGGAFTVKEGEIKNLPQKADYVLQDGYQAKMDEHFSVSSRSIAYKKYVWEDIGGYPEWLTLAADDTIFWRQVRKRNFIYKLTDKPYVYWMRHQTFKAFGKEAERYGLGDGESGINLRTYISHLSETSMRYALGAHVLVMPFYVSTTWWPMLLFIPQLFGLRSYKNAFVRWWRKRSNKYNLRVLFACFCMVEVSRWYYILGYTRGLFSRDKEQTLASRKLLAEIS